MNELVNSKDSGKSKNVKTLSFEQNDKKLYGWFRCVRSKHFANFRSNFTNRRYEIDWKNERQKLQTFD